MNVIGVTGSSGSGKTTLSKILNEREDVKVIDADKVVRELSVPGSEYLKAINETFGEIVFLNDGNLNRKELARKIYNDNFARENLNNLTFNYVVKEIISRIENIKEEKIYNGLSGAFAPHAAHFKINILSSLMILVSGLLHSWQITYFSMYSSILSLIRK